MTVKLIGAVLIICACGGFGFHLVVAQKREEKSLQELLGVLEYISCELQCRLTPLPLLCRMVSQNCSGSIANVFAELANELDMQISPNAGLCMAVALSRCKEIPESSAILLRQLGNSFGRFDLEGQQKELAAVRTSCENKIKRLHENKDARYRTYQTLGLCAGAALAILFI